MLELGLKILISYLIGSLNGSLILGWFKGVDIRTLGSGNAGGTNALRTQGLLFAIGVMAIDIGKGFLPAWILPGLSIAGLPPDPDISRTWLMLACAGASVVGHCYPVWFGFNGGKGAATTIGVLAAVAPDLLMIAGLVWVLVLIVSGFVGLATMTAAVALPIYVGLTDFAARADTCVFLIALAIFVAYTHRSNIQRMRDGTENKMERVMLTRVAGRLFSRRDDRNKSASSKRQ
jgi:glycerol-3-phosphate acyltransferase PlsY